MCGQTGLTLWLTGISGSGKSTLAVELEQRLISSGRLAYRLDGDNLRHGVNAGLGFDAAGRGEAVRRAGEIAILLADAGVVAIVCMISPYADDRDRVRARHKAHGMKFAEVFVDCPLAVAAQRDPKGLYSRAQGGQLAGLTGVSDPYEAPTDPEVHLHTERSDCEACAREVLSIAIG